MMKIRTYPTFLEHAEEEGRFFYISTLMKHKMFFIFEWRIKWSITVFTVLARHLLCYVSIYLCQDASYDSVQDVLFWNSRNMFLLWEYSWSWLKNEVTIVFSNSHHSFLFSERLLWDAVAANNARSASRHKRKIMIFRCDLKNCWNKPYRGAPLSNCYQMGKCAVLTFL